MTDIEKIASVLTEIGIEHTVLSNGEYKYILIGDRRNIHAMDDGKFLGWEDSPLDDILAAHKFIEFENGKLASYFNS